MANADAIATMRKHIDSGKFSLQHYVDLWGRRLEPAAEGGETPRAAQVTQVANAARRIEPVHCQRSSFTSSVV